VTLETITLAATMMAAIVVSLKQMLVIALIHVGSDSSFTTEKIELVENPQIMTNTALIIIGMAQTNVTKNTAVSQMKNIFNGNARKLVTCVTQTRVKGKWTKFVMPSYPRTLNPNIIEITNLLT